MHVDRRRQTAHQNAPTPQSLHRSFHSPTRTTSTRSISFAKPLKTQLVPQTIREIQPKQTKQLSYYLGKGNNEGLVRRVMLQRSNWTETEDSTSAFLNLRWQQDQKGMRYERLVDSGLYRTLYNQFECHEAICNKQLLFRNISSYCSKNNIDIWRIVPPTYLISLKDDCNLQYTKQFLDAYQRHAPSGVTKRLSDSPENSAKTKIRRLFCNSNMKKTIGKAPPISSVFLEEEGEYLWIVKPTFLNRGRGIQVFSKLQVLLKFLSENINGYIEKSLIKEEQEEPSRVIDYVKRNSEQIQLSVLMRDPANREARQKREENCFDGNQYIRVIPRGPAIIKTDRFLVQKYLQRPMLIMNRKFDLRIWVMVTPQIKCYVFPEGYVRLTSMDYSCTDSKDNPFMHLTNHAVQRYANGYGGLADGNQLPFSVLKQEMEGQSLNYEDCIETIYEHIKVSLKATTKLLNPLSRKFCFQILGYDFMIDREGHPWLLQVNNNPSIDESSKLLSVLLPRMLDDAFKISIDPLFFGSVSNGKYRVEGYPDNKNLWILLNTQSK